MRGYQKLLGAGVLAGFVSLTAFAQDEPSVEVRFSDFLNNTLSSVNTVEQEREENFRRSGDDVDRGARSIVADENLRFDDINWAVERLIPELEDFTVQRLAERLVQDNLTRAFPEGAPGTVRVTFDRLRVQDHPVARLSGINTFAKGTFALLDAQGDVVREVKVSQNLVEIPSLDPNYDGPAYAFPLITADNRVGPMMSQFIEKGLKRLFPDQKDAIEGPLMIDRIGPLRRVIN